MTEPKFTKGPWNWELAHIRDGWEKQYSKKDQLRMEKEDWDSGRIFLNNSKNENILCGWGGDGDEGLSVGKEDMNLIKSAPELYEVCEELVKHHNGEDCLVLELIYKKALEALSRARGE